jgi:AraC family transcriptional regulator of adaptative response/methylated-DNA-[protein]-cysteine methyltransferase
VLDKVAAFVAEPAMGLAVPLDMRGNSFQQRVWRALREIPAGATRTYTDVAMRIGAPQSAKEVGEACAANTLAVAVPCHRVVRKDGGLAGYRWGVKRKRALLERESGSDRLAARR